MDKIAAAICEEIKLRKNYLSEKKLHSIYFGGGTPSLLPAGEIEKIMHCIRTFYDIDPKAEITIEANPDDLCFEKLKAYKNAGFNRLSIGIQSFVAADLAYLSRKHDPVQAYKSIELALAAGFFNTGIDLIFGLPTQNINSLEQNLQSFMSFGLPHLSAYALTVEPNTALAWKINKKKVTAVNEETQAEQFLFLMDRMQSAGFNQYEISNYCLPGFESRHNSSYWSGEQYIGLGPSAHSYDGVSRQWNISNLSVYLHAIESGKPRFEKEVLSPYQCYNEYIMMALRTSTGIDKKEFSLRFGTKAMEKLLRKIDKYDNRGNSAWILNTESHIRLSRTGKLFADRIASDLFESD